MNAAAMNNVLLVPLLFLALFTHCNGMKSHKKSNKMPSTPSARSSGICSAATVANGCIFVEPAEFRDTVQAMTALDTDPVRQKLASDLLEKPEFRQLPPDRQQSVFDLVAFGKMPSSASSSGSQQTFNAKNSSGGSYPILNAKQPFGESDQFLNELQHPLEASKPSLNPQFMNDLHHPIGGSMPDLYYPLGGSVPFLNNNAQHPSFSTSRSQKQDSSNPWQLHPEASTTTGHFDPNFGVPPAVFAPFVLDSSFIGPNVPNSSNTFAAATSYKSSSQPFTTTNPSSSPSFTGDIERDATFFLDDNDELLGPNDHKINCGPAGFRGTVQAMTAHETDPMRQDLASRLLKTQEYFQLQPDERQRMYDLVKMGKIPSNALSNVPHPSFNGQHPTGKSLQLFTSQHPSGGGLQPFLNAQYPSAGQSQKRGKQKIGSPSKSGKAAVTFLKPRTSTAFASSAGNFKVPPSKATFAPNSSKGKAQPLILAKMPSPAQSPSIFDDVPEDNNMQLFGPMMTYHDDNNNNNKMDAPEQKQQF